MERIRKIILLEVDGFTMGGNSGQEISAERDAINRWDGFLAKGIVRVTWHRNTDNCFECNSI